eukprot:6189468-Pleurochrysis_carterae.AAC.1
MLPLTAVLVSLVHQQLLLFYTAYLHVCFENTLIVGLRFKGLICPSLGQKSQSWSKRDATRRGRGRRLMSLGRGATGQPARARVPRRPCAAAFGGNQNE